MCKKGTGNDKQGKEAGNRTICSNRNFSQAIIIDTIEEDIPYKITDVSARYFRQKKLSSAGSGVAVPTEDSIMCDVNWTNINLHSILPQAHSILLS